MDETVFLAELAAATDGAPLQPVEIPVIMSRKLRVQAHQPAQGCKSTVSATFSSLCENYLGSTDYHALCNHASTIYLSNLRQFAADEVDIVRRFITLVDIAYESKTRVLCHSTHSVLQTFKNIVMSSHSNEIVPEPIARLQDLMVKGEGGSSSSHATTFIGSMEWSATGRKEASLATGGAGETDVRFAVLRTISRLHEMTSEGYAQQSH
jgi:protein AFG1